MHPRAGYGLVFDRRYEWCCCRSIPKLGGLGPGSLRGRVLGLENNFNFKNVTVRVAADPVLYGSDFKNQGGPDPDPS